MAYSERSRSPRRRLIAAAAAGGLLAAISALAAPASAAQAAAGIVEKAGAAPDLIDTPARLSPRALSSVQLAVARAGRRLVSVGEAGVILLSDNDGREWRQSAGTPVSVALTDVAFIDEARGWAVGHGGVVLATRDGGETWRVQMDGVRAARLLVNEADRLVAKGAAGAEKAKRNAEAMVADGPDKPFLGLFFRDADHGWVVGAYGLALATSDGGATWRSISAAIPNPGGLHLYQARLIGGALTIVGEQGAIFRAAADGFAEDSFESVDGGYEGTLFGVLGLADDGLLAFGLKGNVWKGAADGGTWEKVAIADAASIACGMRLSDGSIVLGGESGRIMIAAAGGLSFAPAGPGVGAAVTGMTQAADGALIVSSARGNHRIALKPQPVETQ